MKISVSSYSFMQYIRAGKLTELDLVEEAHKLGFEAIEFLEMRRSEDVTLDEQKEQAYKIRKRADELGMDINAYTLTADLYKKGEEGEAEVQRLKDQLDVAKILGVSVMRHDATWTYKPEGDARSYKLQLPTIAENARKVTEYGATLGIKTCTENHGLIFQDSYRMEELVCAVNHDNYGLLLDMGNFTSAENPADAFSKLYPYAFHAHCKDLIMLPGGGADPGESFRVNRRGMFVKSVPIGQGNVPIMECLRILKLGNYDGYVSVEYEAAEDCIEGIRKGYENLKKYIAEVESR